MLKIKDNVDLKEEGIWMICDKCGSENSCFCVIYNGNGYTILCQECYKICFQGKLPLGQVNWCGEFNFKAISEEPTLEEPILNKILPLSKRLFGKKIKDLTKEEHKEYNRICAKNNYKYVKKGYKTDWTIKNLGKRYRDLNEEEKREFWKMQTRLSRQRKSVKEGNNV